MNSCTFSISKKLFFLHSSLKLTFSTLFQFSPIYFFFFYSHLFFHFSNREFHQLLIFQLPFFRPFSNITRHRLIFHLLLMYRQRQKNTSTFHDDMHGKMVQMQLNVRTTRFLLFVGLITSDIK
jgi:hypothetical protein